MSPEDLQALLAARGETVACAESLTGGELAALLSRAPGASAVFRGGVVSYATEVKRNVLGVTADHVISEECAIQMAESVRSLLGSDWGVSTTGVAGPDSQEGQPVGTVFVGIAGPQGASAARLWLSGTRDE
ncbi:MAG TPA: nicotinamide-nucleotide amidohydrolase family protein, partial [Marmoricola sp.]|nr:nicotinamide-nucleotide amidohydrolase family protein [Marmoricola sp.]